jgi:hypothetical protein
MAVPAGSKQYEAVRGRTSEGRPPLGCFRCDGTEEARAAALARVDDVEGSWLRAGLDDAFALVAGRFYRREVRVRARACLGGMLSGLERKTGWALAEHAGEAGPDGMQRLFTTARWDAGGVRDDLRGYVAAVLGDPDGVLIGDDTGFEKGGCRSAGVQRQYTGTAGKITNCQLGVFLAYSGPKGRALVDRELYLPRSWTGDRQRLAAAGVPEGTGFRTKPQLLELMIDRGRGRDPVRLDRGRRGLRRQRPAAGRPGGTADRLRPGRCPRSRPGHGGGQPPGRRPGREAAQAGLAAGQLRQRRQGRAPLRLGTGRLGPPGDLAADPPERLTAVRARLLPLPHAPPGPAQPPGGGRRGQVGGRGVLPGRQERNRDGPLPGQALRKLVPLRHPRHARPCLPRRHPGHPRRR